MRSTRVLVYLGLFVAMDVILTRFLSFQTQFLRVSFGFIPVSFSAIFFGPVIGAFSAAVGDLLGWVLVPKGPLFLGFTVSQIIVAAIYGFFLYRKPKSILRIFLATLVAVTVVDLFMNSLWLSMLYGQAYTILLAQRLLKSIIMLPVQTAVIYALWRMAGRFIEANFLERKSLA